MLAVESKVARADAADSLKTDPKRSWTHLVEPLEPFLQAVAQRLIEQVNGFDPQIVPYAQYALSGSGKRLRPPSLRWRPIPRVKPRMLTSTWRLSLKWFIWPRWFMTT